MSKTFGVTIIETITREAHVIVRAPDIHEAKDLAYDFARKNPDKVAGRFRTVGWQLEAYNGRAMEISGPGLTVDAEV